MAMGRPGSLGKFRLVVKVLQRWSSCSKDTESDLHVTEDHLGDDVKTRLLVGDGLDHTNGDEENDTNEDADNVRPPWQVSRPDLGSNHAKGKTDDEDDREPPLRGLLVLAHKLQVDIRLLRTRAEGAAPDIGTIEKTTVEDGGNKSSEGHSVGQRKCRTKKNGRVLLVGGFVDGIVGRQDSGGVVRLSPSVPVLVGTEGKVLVLNRAAVGETNGSDHADKQTETDVENGEERRLQRTSKPR